MSTANPRKSHLKIGLIYNGRVVEECVVPPGEAVTVGADDRRNTIGFPAERTPVSVELFTGGAEGWVLQADSCRRVRVMADGEVQPTGAGASVPLPEDAQGRLQLGGLTVVFRCVERPNGVARAALPKDVEQTPTGLLDRSVLAVLVLAVVATAGLTGWFEFGEWPQQKENPTLQPNQQFATIESRQAMPVEPPEPEPESEPEDDAAQAAAPTNDSAEMQPPRPPADAEPAEAESDPAPAETTVAEEESAPPAEETSNAESPSGSETNRREVAEGTILEADMEAIGSLTEDGEMERRTEQAFNGASERESRPGGSSGGRPATAGGDSEETGRAVGGGELNPSELSERAEQHRESTDRQEVRVSTRQPIEPRDPEKLDKCVDRRAMSRAFRRRAQRLQGCYERLLKKNPSAGGKINVAVSVGAGGRVTGVRATTDSVGGGVAGCVARELATLSFERTCDSGTVEFRKSFVFSPGR
jgi:hypothetical protein